jgi:hypothetical protein
MANLIAERQKSSFPEFADRKQLAEDATRFCIDEVKLHTQKDGKTRWYLTIRYLEDGGTAVKTLTFDQSPSRDELFAAMQESEDYPQHNCWVSKRSFKNKGTGMMQTFYQLEQENARGQDCVCTIEDDPGPDEPPAEDDTGDPFLPDFDALN